MTVAVCTNCGELKFGACCECGVCGSSGLDSEVSILLSDHYLSEDELLRIGNVLRVIHDTELDEETRFYLLEYYLDRKWPKLLKCDIDAIEPELQKQLDTLYRSKLAGIPGQEEPSLKVSPLRQREWTRAVGAHYQEEEDVWKVEVAKMLSNGIDVATRIGSLAVEAGEGAVLQRFTHFNRTLFRGCDYRRLVGRCIELIGDASEYRRTVDAFCARVKNGWSGRTDQQAAYFRGWCKRLEEMADRLKTIIEHKAGINVLIDMDLKRVRQEYDQSYETLLALGHVVLDPSRINPDGTCKLD